MSFLSIEFAVFFLSLFPVYWALAEHPRMQNLLLLLVGLGCLGAVNPLFALAVVLFASAIYLVSEKMAATGDVLQRKYWLRVGIVLALVNLCFFKYFDFFRPQLREWFGAGVIDILMPLGISYYTFQAIAYLTAAEKRPELRLKWQELLFHFSFFPTITAGRLSVRTISKRWTAFKPVLPHKSAARNAP